MCFFSSSKNFIAPTIDIVEEDELDEAEYSKVQDVVGTVAATASGGTSTDKLDMVFNVLMKSLPFVVPLLGVIIGTSINWPKKLFK